MKKLKIPDKQWDEKIWFVYDCPASELVEYIRKRAHRDFSGVEYFDGFYFNVPVNGCDEHYIWMEEFDWTITHQAMLGHEIIHLVNEVLWTRGFELNRGSQEAWAYYFQHLMGSFWHVLKPKPDPKRKRKKK